ncbi:MAG: hypothetical protein ACYDCL_15870 [Myxococcales bacterium]
MSLTRSSTARIVVGLMAVVGATRPGLAAPVDGGPDALTVERLRTAAAESALDRCRVAAQSLEAQAGACTGELAARTRDLGSCRFTASECRASQEATCTEAQSLVQSVLLDELPAPAGPACVPVEHQRALAGKIAGWLRAGGELEALRQFESGESDRVPKIPRAPADTRAEALVAGVLGGPDGPRFLYRRLLIEALRRISPPFWRRLAATGAAAIDGWFGSSEPLDPDLARGTEAEPAGEPHGAEPPPLVSALDLVESYLELAGCAGRERPVGECRRARELRDLLQQSGPLVVERRERSIWAADCRDVSRTLVGSWLEPFPTSGAAPAQDGWRRITRAAQSKLFACFLAEPAAGPLFSDWVAGKLPDAPAVGQETLKHVGEIEARWIDGSPEDLCARAVRTLQTLRTPRDCALPQAALDSLRAWVQVSSGVGSTSSVRLRACAAAAQLLWSGDGVRIATQSDHVPSPEEIAVRTRDAAPTPMAGLRALCGERRGSESTFANDIGALASLARSFGEHEDSAPWHVDPRSLSPFEDVALGHAATLPAWATNLALRRSACDALHLGGARCAVCGKIEGPLPHDCAALVRLSERWRLWDRQLLIGLLALVFLAAAALWAARLGRALRGAAPWAAQVRVTLSGLGFSLRPDGWRLLFPSRFSRLIVQLPAGPAWERWGRRATAVRAEGPALTERSVDEAAMAALRSGSEVALLIHAEGVSPELGAVRSMLEWAAKGGRRAVQVLPVSRERLQWAHSPDDLLDLVEQSSLRGNPFEVRGRIGSSSQFFNRERLVSGLLAATAAGHWTLVTGLRRMGKSSLALEVSRRIHGPSAHVDLAGFHHELTTVEDPSEVADGILRYICVRLHASARELYPDYSQPVSLPAGPGSLDAGRLAEWLSAFARGCRRGSGGRPGAALLILDEIEQGLSAPAAGARRALAAFEIVVGRLRAAFGDIGSSDLQIGVILCGALHPLLWAPLATLTGQSIVGAFPWVSVPALTREAAEAMMRSLGAWHGIRFKPEALELIIREGNGIPLLVRRLGSAVLELFDPERALQGSLGAVEIGIEGARAAVRREAEDGSPTRVWIESEIGEGRSVVGLALREAARRGELPTSELARFVAELTLAQFSEVGLDAIFPAEERRRRAQEAGGVIVRILQETGLLVPVGELTRPERLAFPDGLLRRILSEAAGSAARLVAAAEA